MEVSKSQIVTGPDKLVQVVDKYAKISIKDAMREVGAARSVVLEWAEFLEEEGILSIQHGFTKTYLISRKMAPHEIKKKSKEYDSKKSTFIRKAEGTAEIINKEKTKLEEFKKEYDRLKSDFSLDTIKEELKKLDSYHKTKLDLDKEFEKQRKETKLKVLELNRELNQERKKYAHLVNEIAQQKKSLQTETKAIEPLQHMETLLEKKLDTVGHSFISWFSKIRNQVKEEQAYIRNLEAQLLRLNSKADTIEKKTKTEMDSLIPYVERIKTIDGKIADLQNKVIEKIADSDAELKKVKNASKKVKSLFSKKLGFIELVNRMSKERSDLEEELQRLILKARSLEISSDNPNVEHDISDLENQFLTVQKKSKLFEKELEKLRLATG